jgi:hypothetical protein
LIKEGQRCLDQQNLDDALHLFGEAMAMDKWKPLYGSSILSSLAYIQSLKGNITLAKQYILEYDTVYGSDPYDEEEDKKISYVRFILESENA